jgi:asparagine synthetase B (glutamine-hydrolysing)
VYPGRAVEIKDGFAQRVTSESCLHTLSQNVLDRNTGLLSRENFSLHAFEKAAVGVQVSENSNPNSAACQVHVAEDQCVVFVGKLENAQELMKMHIPQASGATNDAALIGHLYKQKDGNKHSYPFLGELKGSFAFALYDRTADSCLAARDESGKYMMFQVRVADPLCRRSCVSFTRLR